LRHTERAIFARLDHEPARYRSLFRAAVSEPEQVIQKKPFGIPTREMREAGPRPLPEARLRTASKAPMKESIIELEQMDGAVECVPAKTICP